MYFAAKKFKTPQKVYNKGDVAPEVEAWIEAGLIEEGKGTKPKPEPKKETKPHKEAK